MRKKFLFVMAFAAVAVASNAQDAYVGNKFFDNWYIGVRRRYYSNYTFGFLEEHAWRSRSRVG